MQLTTKIQVLIEAVDKDGTAFRDALYFTPAEHAALIPAAIEVMATQRVDAWKAILRAAPRASTKEEEQLQLVAMVDEKARLESDIVALTTKIAAEPAKDVDAIAVKG